MSFVIGVPENGRHASRPHHLFYKLTKHLPVGGLVDGPVYKEINDSLKFDTFDDDELEHFQSDVAVYHDLFADFSTNEPIIDGTVSLLCCCMFGSRSRKSNASRRVRSSAATLRRKNSRWCSLAIRMRIALPILDTLRERGIDAGFFLTGNFVRNQAFRPAIDRMLAEGHYLGPHSD